MECLDFQLLLFISAYSLSLYSVLMVLVFKPLFIELSAGNPSESQSVSLPMLASLWAEVVFLFSLGCVLPLPDRLIWCHHLNLSVLHRAPSVLARVWLLTTPPVQHPAGPDGCTSSAWCLQDLNCIQLSCWALNLFVGYTVVQIHRSSLLQELSKFYGPQWSRGSDREEGNNKYILNCGKILFFLKLLVRAVVSYAYNFPVAPDVWGSGCACVHAETSQVLSDVLAPLICCFCRYTEGNSAGHRHECAYFSFRGTFYKCPL